MRANSLDDLMTRPCPLCQTPQPKLFFHSPQRDYLRCQRCGSIFVPKDDLLPPEAEKARYDLHENDPANKGYRKFLQQLTRPLIAHIDPPPQHGLDFGSGPGPVLAQMLETQGYTLSLYDPFYAPDPKVLNRTYDFVTCTEVVEHFYHPAREWEQLIHCLKPGGWLEIMTKLIDDLSSFPNLHCITDRTHVSFFSRQTLEFLTKRDGLDIKLFGDNTILIHKPMSHQGVRG